MSLGGALAEAFVRLRVDSAQVAGDTSKGIKEGAAAGDAETAGAGAGKKFGAAFGAAAKTAMVVGLGAAVAIAAASAHAAVEFQSQMAKVQTQAGASASSVQHLTKAVLELAPSTQQGPQQLAEALYHLKSLGMDDADAMKALKTSSDLAAVGGANLEATTNALGAAWRSGIRGASDFGTAAATVNAIIGAGNMKMEDFVSALSSGILPAAKTFGLSLTQVGSAMAVMTDEGIPAQLAATRLRMSLSLLGAPSQQAEKYLKEIGLTGLQLGESMRSPGGLVATIGLLKQHLADSGMTAAETAQLLSRAFGGGQSSSAILTLISNFNVLKLKQDQINAGISRYGTSVAVQRQTAEAQLHLLGSAFETLGIQIGSALLPPLTKFVQFLAGTVMPKVSTFVNGALKLIGVGGPKGPSPAQQQAQYAQAVAGTLSRPATTGGAPPVLGAMGVTPAVQTAPKIYPTQTASKTGSEIVNSIVDSLVKNAGKIGAAVLQMLGKIDWAGLGKQAAMAGVPFVIGLVNNLAQALISEAVHHPLDMLTFVLSLIPIGRVAGILGEVLGHIPIVGKLAEFLLKPLEAAGGLVEKGVGKILGPFLRLGGRVLDAISAPFKRVGVFLVKEGEDALLGLARGFGVGWRAASGWLRGIAGRVLSAAGKLARTLFQPGIDLIKGLIAGFQGRWGDAASLFKGIPGKILAFFVNSATLLYKVGLAILKSLLNGAENVLPGVLSWVKGIPARIVSAVGDLGHLLWNAGKAVLTGFLGGLKSIWSGVTSFVSGIGSWIADHKGPIEKDKVLLVPHGKAIMDSLINGMKSKTGELKKFLGGVATTITALSKESPSLLTSQLATATKQQAAAQKQVNTGTADVKKLQAARTSEENQIKKLIAARAREYAQSHTANQKLRAEQEKQIKSLQKLRSAQEAQIKTINAALKPLKSELSKLKTEVTRLQKALAKSQAAASSASSTDDGTDTGDGSTPAALPNWSAFNAWMRETGPVDVTGGAAAGFQLSAGPFGGMGVGPRPLGRWSGPPRWMSGGPGDMTPAMLARLDELINVARQQPGRTAAGLNAAMNGVTARAIVGGNW